MQRGLRKCEELELQERQLRISRIAIIKSEMFSLRVDTQGMTALILKKGISGENGTLIVHPQTLMALFDHS